MACRILKYEIPVQSNQFTMILPAHLRFLCIQTQYEIPQLWVLTDTCLTAPKQYNFLLLTTGERTELSIGDYLGTFQLTSGNFVGHVFLEGIN